MKKFLRVDLPRRVFDTKLPEIEIVDLRLETKKGNFSPLSEKLFAEISAALQKKSQIIIFLNQRGFAGATMCKICGQKFECKNCTANLKLHRKNLHEKLICHICGRIENFPEKCPQCNAKNFEFRGWGTQMVEQILVEKFPEKKIARADADTISGKFDFQKILQNFGEKKIDILLGTQMIAKGLDFENVALVGVILADVGLNLPDPRAEEKIFQILTQVAGRAGRRKNRGKILVQTFSPDAEIFQFLKKNDTENFLARELELREKMFFPPFCAAAKITFSDADKKKCFDRAQKFFKFCEKNFAENFENKKKIAEKSDKKKLKIDEIFGEKKVENSENNFLKNEKNFAEFLRENLILQKNFGEKNLENCEICAEKKILKNKILGENFENKIAEISRNGAEKIEQKFCAADFKIKKNAENFCENSKNIFEKNLEKMADFCEKNNFKKEICADFLSENFGIEKKIAAEILEKFEKNGGKKLVNFAPAFFPRTHGKFHFHVFLRATEKKFLHEFLGKLKFAAGAKIDISPASFL